jgi:nitrite reductase (NADH) small subunit
MVVGEQVVCPYHAFRYHGTTGECDQAGTCAITTYPVELTCGSVFVAVPQA